MYLEAIQDHIAANTTLQTGVDLFVEGFPAHADTGVLLTTEPLADPGVDIELRGRFRHRFQVIVRDPDRADGQARADELFWLLFNSKRQSLGDYVVHYMHPRHAPIPYRRSEGDAVEFSINVDTMIDYPNVPAV